MICRHFSLLPGNGWIYGHFIYLADFWRFFFLGASLLHQMPSISFSNHFCFSLILSYPFSSISIHLYPFSPLSRALVPLCGLRAPLTVWNLFLVVFLLPSPFVIKISFFYFSRIFWPFLCLFLCIFRKIKKIRPYLPFCALFSVNLNTEIFNFCVFRGSIYFLIRLMEFRHINN